MSDNNKNGYSPYNVASDIAPYVDTTNLILETMDKEQRRRDVSELYANYLDIMKTPVVIEWNVFVKYLPLFKQDVLNSINPTDKEQTEPYKELCEEFMRLINPFKEYHVRMLDGELITFPPVLNMVSRLHADLAQTTDAFANILHKCNDQPWRRDKATIDLITAIAYSQNENILKLQQHKYSQYTKELMTRIHQDREVTESNELELDTNEFTSNMDWVDD